MNGSNNFFKIERDPEGNFIWNGLVDTPLGGNEVRFGDREFDMNPHIQKAISNAFRNSNKLYDYDEFTGNRIQKCVEKKLYT